MFVSFVCGVVKVVMRVAVLCCRLTFLCAVVFGGAVPTFALGAVCGVRVLYLCCAYQWYVVLKSTVNVWTITFLQVWGFRLKAT